MINEVWNIEQISSSLVPLVCQKFANFCQQFGIDSDFMIEVGNIFTFLHYFDNPEDLLRSSFSISEHNVHSKMLYGMTIRQEGFDCKTLFGWKELLSLFINCLFAIFWRIFRFGYLHTYLIFIKNLSNFWGNLLINMKIPIILDKLPKYLPNQGPSHNSMLR